MDNNLSGHHICHQVQSIWHKVGIVFGAQFSDTRLMQWIAGIVAIIVNVTNTISNKLSSLSINYHTQNINYVCTYWMILLYTCYSRQESAITCWMQLRDVFIVIQHELIKFKLVITYKNVSTSITFSIYISISEVNVR